jgi:hypothetical protein
MPANTTPIFTVTPDINWGTTNPIGTVAVTSTAATSYDGTTSAVLLYTAGTNGSFVQKLVFEAAGTNATASVARIFINNGSTNATAANNTLFMQYSLPTSTASNTTATSHVEVPLMLQLPASYRVYILISSSANLGAGWFVTVVAGDY